MQIVMNPAPAGLAGPRMPWYPMWLRGSGLEDQHRAAHLDLVPGLEGGLVHRLAVHQHGPVRLRR